MSALEVIPVKGKDDKFCSFEGCIKDGLIKYANFRIQIIGYHAGNACKDCAKKFKILWESSLDGRDMGNIEHASTN